MTAPASRARFAFRVELYLGAVLGWVDITADVRGQVAITRGLSAEGNRANPGACSLRLDNSSGDYSPRNPAGQWYGYLGRNTPLRVSAGPVGGSLVGRFYGEVSEWPVRWSLDEVDRYVDVTASGILRRLNQGEQPSWSALRRTIAGTGPLAYWPLEDGSDAGQGGSAVAGVEAMAITGTAPFDDIESWTDRQFTVAYGTAALVDISQGAILAASLPATVTAATASGWTVNAVAEFPDITELTADFVFLEVDTPGGTYVRWRMTMVKLPSRQLQIVAYSAAGAATVVATLSPSISMWPKGLVVWQNGANINVGFQWDSVAGWDVTGSVAGTLAGVTAIRINPTAATPSTVPIPVGHLALWAGQALDVIDLDDGPILSSLLANVWTNASRGGSAAVTGEAATARLARVWTEDQGVTVSIPTAETDPVMLGVQKPATLTEVTDQAVTADGGLLYEARDSLNLRYRTRASLYNQTPVKIAYTGQLSPPFDPVDDADDTRNDVTVKRTDGSSARAVETSGPLAAVPPPAGVGVYRTEVELNLVDDKGLTDQASWRVHLGTVDQPRYPAVSVQLAAPGWDADPTGRAALLGVDTGDVLEVTGLPTWAAGDARTMVVGYAETFDEWTWSITYSGVPAQPWDVAVVAGDARVAADATTLATALGAPPEVTAQINTLASNWAWTQAAADFPLDIGIGGERVTASAIGPAVSDTFTRTTASGWGTADTGQAWTVSGGAVGDYSVDTARGVMSQGSVMVLRTALLDAAATDTTVMVDIPLTPTPTGGSNTYWLLVRATDVNNHYIARLEVPPTGNVVLALLKRVGGALTGLGASVSIAPNIGQTWRILADVRGSTLRAKAWRFGTNDEPEWLLTATDTALTTGSRIGVAARLETGNTSALPVLARFDNFTVTNLQRLTLSARGVNGLARAWPAGTEVDVWQPAISPL